MGYLWREGPLYYRLASLGECSKNLSVAVCQLALTCFSEVFWRLFQHVCSFHDGWFTSAPATTVLSVQQFLIKMAWHPHPISPQAVFWQVFFFFLMFPGTKRNPLKETFAEEEVKHTHTKWQKHQKASKSMSSKTVLSSGKRSCYRYCIKWRAQGRWLKFNHVKISTQFL